MGYVDREECYQVPDKVCKTQQLKKCAMCLIRRSLSGLARVSQRKCATAMLSRSLLVKLLQLLQLLQLLLRKSLSLQTPLLQGEILHQLNLERTKKRRRRRKIRKKVQRKNWCLVDKYFVKSKNLCPQKLSTTKKTISFPI